MIKIFYGNIFISDLITNKSMTIEEMLEIIDFDAEAFKEKRGFDSLDPADFRAVHFDSANLHTREMSGEVADKLAKESYKANVGRPNKSLPDLAKSKVSRDTAEELAKKAGNSYSIVLRGGAPEG